jgi:phage-related protein (TIGR01555 family)
MSQTALAQFQMRMDAVNQMLSNQSLIALPEDGGLEHISQTFAGLADTYQQFQLDIAGAAEYPVTRLFGRTITGLGQSNDADERIYEEKIAVYQEDDLRPQLDKLFPVIYMSELGEVPDDLSYTFPSIRVLTEEEKATLAQNASPASSRTSGTRT